MRGLFVSLRHRTKKERTEIVDWSKTAFVFPGQGSQFVGMGKSIAETSAAARLVFEEADDILQTNFSGLMFDGPENHLNDTYNTQASLFVAGVAALRALQAELPEANPAFAAGHSLGEFTALVCAASLSFADGLRLVRERGALMKQSGADNPGGMGAMLGLDVAKAQSVVDEAATQTDEVLVIANDNCPGQVVISGGAAATERALELGKQAGAKRAVRLALSVAAHSPLMQPAADAFEQKLAEVDFQPPALPVYGNVSARPLSTPDEIRHELSQQIVAPVRWTESVQAMIEDGAQTFVEIGAGSVLSGLIRRIDRSVERIVVEDKASLAKFVQHIRV